MATGKRSRSYRPSLGPQLLLALLVLGAALGFFYRAEIAGYSSAGTAYGARTACSCRYVAGRELADCRKDFEPGMAMVFLSDDEEEHSVTAYVPAIASQTARWREGYGCQLEPWDG